MSLNNINNILKNNKEREGQLHIDNYGRAYYKLRDKYLKSEYVNTEEYVKDHPLNLGKEIESGKKYSGKGNFTYKYCSDRI